MLNPGDIIRIGHRNVAITAVHGETATGRDIDGNEGRIELPVEPRIVGHVGDTFFAAQF